MCDFYRSKIAILYKFYVDMYNILDENQKIYSNSKPFTCNPLIIPAIPTVFRRLRTTFRRLSVFSGDLAPLSGDFPFFPATSHHFPATFRFFRRPAPLPGPLLLPTTSPNHIKTPGEQLPGRQISVTYSLTGTTEPLYFSLMKF
jgi:hypothetical protein